MSEAETIDSTKTVVVAPDVHTAIRHIATDRDQPIKETTDELLRSNSAIEKELNRSDE